MRRRLLAALFAALAVLGLATALPAPAGAVTATASRVCTAKGSCVSVTKAASTNVFTVTVLTCTRGDSFQVGIRGYFTNGDWTTSTTRTVTCGTTLPRPATRTYIGNRLVSWRGFVGPRATPRLGTLAGAALPTNGFAHESGGGFGFHWD